MHSLRRPAPRTARGAGDVRHSQANIERAKEALDYAPPIDVREGLRRTLEWYRSRRV